MSRRLTTVLDVESELDGLLWLSVDADATLLQNSRESSESNQQVGRVRFSKGGQAGNRFGGFKSHLPSKVFS